MYANWKKRETPRVNYRKPLRKVIFSNLITYVRGKIIDSTMYSQPI
jgi:hypothetical protein